MIKTLTVPEISPDQFILETYNPVEHINVAKKTLARFIGQDKNKTDLCDKLKAITEDANKLLNENAKIGIYAFKYVLTPTLNKNHILDLEVIMYLQHFYKNICEIKEDTEKEALWLEFKLALPSHFKTTTTFHGVGIEER